MGSSFFNITGFFIGAFVLAHPLFGLADDKSKLNYAKNKGVIEEISNEYLYNVNKLLDQKIRQQQLKKRRQKLKKKKHNSSLTLNQIYLINECLKTDKKRNLRDCARSASYKVRNMRQFKLDLLRLGLDLQKGVNPFEYKKKPKPKRYKFDPITGKIIWY